jgi:formylglycine-generating enzyme required for sulfatase activity
MIHIPEGYFPMGADTPEENPLHFIYTSAYFIDKYEVSNAQYKEFMTAKNHPAPKFWNDKRFNQPEQAVVGVSWHDAAAYAAWKGNRLPTEAEWEKAARGKEGLTYPWGNKADNIANLANIRGRHRNAPAAVDSYTAGASPYGVLNMAGNVAEWCLDWFDRDYYNHSPEMNPEGPAKPVRAMKVLRGGSWLDNLDNVKTFRRLRNYPHIKNNAYGFRTVRPIP